MLIHCFKFTMNAIDTIETMIAVSIESTVVVNRSRFSQKTTNIHSREFEFYFWQQNRFFDLDNMF